MNVREVRREAKKRFNGLCRVCRDCNGVVSARRVRNRRGSALEVVRQDRMICIEGEYRVSE